MSVDSDITSVWESSDKNFFKLAIPFYWWGQGEPKILDATYGLGRFWQGSSFRVVGIDIVPQVDGIKQMDNRKMDFSRAQFDIVIYDPPHLTRNKPPSKPTALGHFTYFIGRTPVVDYPAFINEAKRVLRPPHGILIAKIGDSMDRWHKSEFQHTTFIRDAEYAGLTVCDLVVKTRKRGLLMKQHKIRSHARKRHAFYIICRLKESSCCLHCEKKKW